MTDTAQAHVLPVRRLGGWVLKPAPSTSPSQDVVPAYVLQHGSERVTLVCCADLLLHLLADLDRIRQPPHQHEAGGKAKTLPT
ncbi:hypothetical protein [Streptomyces sp. NPDC045470]|uniref:hypothetical protein n=1 Tax=Streptomyces sp. NPDC045470 TaxID=3155469 RepID=UPI00340B41AF